MGWQQREGGVYYYRSLRLNGRVRCWYFGRGLVADAADVEDQLYRLDRQEAKERRQAALARQQAVDAALDRLCGVATLLAHATLLAAGYHQHARGQWRRRRVAKSHTRPG